MVVYYILRLLCVLVPLLPERLGYWLADSVGQLAYLLNRRLRANVEGNLRRVLGGDADGRQIGRVARQVFRTQARNYLDLLRLPSMKLVGMDRLVEVDNWEHVRAALAPGKGAIVAAAHLGNLEVIAQVAVANGYSVTIPVEPIKPPQLFELISSLRASRGLNPVPANETGLKTIYQALRRNELVAMGADRDILGNGILVPFFGELAAVPYAPALLALRTGAPILAVHTMRRTDGKGYAVHVEPPLWLKPTGDRQRDVREGTVKVTATLERFIRANPGQWVVFEPVWKEKAQASLTAEADESPEPAPLAEKR